MYNPYLQAWDALSNVQARAFYRQTAISHTQKTAAVLMAIAEVLSNWAIALIAICNGWQSDRFEKVPLLLTGTAIKGLLSPAKDIQPEVPAKKKRTSRKKTVPPTNKTNAKRNQATSV